MTENINVGITDVRKIIEVLRINYDIDLSGLALISFKNRIERFLSISSDVKSTQRLIDKLNDKSFLNIFLKEISVEKTELFRNPSVWRYLRDTLLPDLMSFANPVKVWFPFTTSSEDFLSFAILLHESNNISKVQVNVSYLFNLWEQLGVFYPVSASKFELSLHNYHRFNEKGDLNNYFNFQRNEYIFKKEFIQSLNYTQNTFTIADTQPSGSFNLIICRDFLIYTNSTLHDKLFSLFNNALRKNSYLILGVKEQITFCKESRKYQKLENVEGVFKKIVADL